MEWLAAAYLALLVVAAALYAYILIIFNAASPLNAPEQHPACRLHLRLKNHHMANVVGSSKLLQVVPDGALAADPQESVSASDPTILSFEADPAGNPLNRKVNFLAAGTATINVTAINSDGNQVSGSLDVTVDPAAATTLALSIVDLP